MANPAGKRSRDDGAEQRGEEALQILRRLEPALADLNGAVRELQVNVREIQTEMKEFNTRLSRLEGRVSELPTFAQTGIMAVGLIAGVTGAGGLLVAVLSYAVR